MAEIQFATETVDATFFLFFFKSPWIKPKDLHFNHSLFVWFKIHCDGVQGQNYKDKCIIVEELTAYVDFRRRSHSV